MDWRNYKNKWRHSYRLNIFSSIHMMIFLTLLATVLEADPTEGAPYCTFTVVALDMYLSIHNKYYLLNYRQIGSREHLISCEIEYKRVSCDGCVVLY